ncbi:helix-turn-helix domain-containing protein [Hymenobacter lucidus]|uniref:Helix-turn-helix transcriptional regulator n=1 Tax=Hymenobacter lucidus TaxID=2880930 RepID=A0ABS8ATJ6_9BACT|nr:helix-turn-helix domain-containing protein [Hymenobacter lucidus]MCB2408036.1 helix-turn-helix transcriptional regulator [Hymenobacter lucidus]
MQEPNLDQWTAGFALVGLLALLVALFGPLAYLFLRGQLRLPPGPKTATPESAAPLPTSMPVPRYQNSGLPPQLARHWAQRLEELMQTEHLYRRSDLRLDTLADRLGLSRHHLSQVLNEQLGLHFFEYVNSLRVAEAQELLRNMSRRQLYIIEVAYAVGFNNKVSFNKAFKAATGLTPSEFRQQALDNPDRNFPLSRVSVLAKG